MRIYHYTNTETLALILKNRTIRFNRLDQVDDLEEGKSESSGIKIGQYLFVSCWTENPEESIPLWRMYTDKGVGVRIGMDKEMFKTYIYNDGEIVNGVLMKGQVKTLLSPDMMALPNLFIFPCFNDGVFYRGIQYVPNVAAAIKDAIKRDGNGSFKFELSKCGTFKNLRWAFQNESRFVLNIYPKPSNISTGDKIFATWLCSVLEQEIPNEINYYDVDLDVNALNSMEITLCPNMSEGNKILVESLCKTYLNNVVPKSSSLTGVVRLK